MTRTTEERIMTLHPEGKKGVHITRTKYDAMKRAILKVVPRRRSGLALEEMYMDLLDHLDDDAFPGGRSVKWYAVTVKQDLEARGIIEQVPSVKPQHLRRVGTKS